MNKLILCLLCFSVTSFGQNFDKNTVLKWNQNRSTSLDDFYLGLSQSADYVAIGTPLTLLAVGLIKDDKSLKRNGIQSGIALLGTYGVGFILKKTIKRERPFLILDGIIPIQIKDSYSMPSGSSAVAFATATSLTMAFPKWYVAIPGFGYASAVSYARIRSGEHYPSDVLAGAVLGAGSVWVSGKLMKWINK
jgi:membrane-associated phospholipid phosphatase